MTPRHASQIPDRVADPRPLETGRNRFPRPVEALQASIRRDLATLAGLPGHHALAKTYGRWEPSAAAPGSGSTG